MKDNFQRLAELLPGADLSDDLKEWLRNEMDEIRYSQRRRDALLATAVIQSPAETLFSKCQQVSDALVCPSDDPVIQERQGWPGGVPKSVRRLKVIASRYCRRQTPQARVDPELTESGQEL